MNNDMTILTNHMFLATLLIATGGLKAIYGGWFVRESEDWSIIVTTQRLRYTVTMIGGLISIIPGYGLLAVYGWNDFQDGTGQWMGSSMIGMIVAAAMWYALISPFVVLLAVRHIYRFPSRLARRTGGGWVTTRDVRLRVTPLPVYNRH